MRVLGTSAFVPELLMQGAGGHPALRRRPERAQVCSTSSPDAVARALVASAGRHADPVRAIAAARTLRRHELARIASADLLGMLEVTDVCRALTSVWVAVLQAALEAVIRANAPDDGAPARIAVIGMGRLGGGELGYGSDADVMFVCEPDRAMSRSRVAVQLGGEHRRAGAYPAGHPERRPAAGGRHGSAARGPQRPAGAHAGVVRGLLHAMGAAVGDSGAAARTPGGGRRRPRSAVPADGDKTRYPPGGVSPEAVREIRRIKARVDAERLPRGADPNTHTKLGRGGLADIEWTVQLLQLRHAHKIPALHNTSTLETLNAIGAAELIAEGDVDLLRQAWLTATRARNALVLVRGKPTDQLPGPGRQLNAVALAAGWGNDDGGEFLDNYLRVTRRAKTVVRKVFGA